MAWLSSWFMPDKLVRSPKFGVALVGPPTIRSLTNIFVGASLGPDDRIQSHYRLGDSRHAARSRPPPDPRAFERARFGGRRGPVPRPATPEGGLPCQRTG